MASKTIELTGNDFVIAAKMKALQKLADNLDADALEAIVALSTNKKAIDFIKNPPGYAKAFLKA